MNPTIIKICGLRRPEDADAIAGADYAGLNFVAGRRRAIDVPAAQAIVDRLDGPVPVGVFLDQPQAEVIALSEATGLTHVQLHGAESPETCAELARRFTVIKALAFDAIDRADDYAPHVAALLVDGRRPGAGNPWDLDRLAPHLRDGRLAGRPLWLAGGLSPDNVAGAIDAIAPAGVDAASGVERDGAIDFDRAQAFIAAARAASTLRLNENRS